jgi:hypothetical protein
VKPGAVVVSICVEFTGTVAVVEGGATVVVLKPGVVTVFVCVELAVTVTVVEGAATVVVLWVTPMHEQALEYRTLPEQGDA